MLTPDQWDRLKKHPDFSSDLTYVMINAEEAAGIPGEVMDATYLASRHMSRIYGSSADRLREAYRQMAPQEDVPLQEDLPLAA